MRPSGGRSFLAVPPDPREQLTERKRQILTVLRELEFEHEAGHIGHDDYAELQARYEAEASEILTGLDRLGARPEREARSARVEKPPIELRSEEHTSELQSLTNLVCRLLLEKKKKQHNTR